MERALNLDLLRAALGQGGMFPPPEEVQRRLAEAEIALFLQRGAVDDELLATAWYLHGVGTSRASLQIYPVERQLQANQVAAHIFDLALSAGIASEVVRREMTFAAQVSYLRGDLDPNAIALYQRLPRSEPRLRDEPGAVSLDVGSAVLALDRRRLFGGRLPALRREARQLARIVGVTDLTATPYGAAARVVEGCYNLIVHLTYNQPDRLERARQLFDEGTDPPFAQFDLDSRWVAAHLRDIADDLGTTSIWAHLPPSVPPAAARAMTLGEPPVLSLWPPQLELLNGTPSPLDPAVRRLVLSFPTSAGKTLMAQYIVAAHVASGAGSACVVVPTHSLGRELRRDLDRRLSTIGRQAADAGPLGLPLPPPPSAVVMTPEKLAAHLRLEPDRMLSEYSLYVIDEAHLVGDAERGWVLESALGFLHGATYATNHRIVVLSAALGNRAHVAAWLGLDGQPAQLFHHDWRGPRRAHALFGTWADRDHAEPIPPRRKGGLVRQRRPLHGEIHVRTAPGQHHSLRTTNPISSLVLVLRDGTWKRERGQGWNEPAYVIRARMATLLGEHGQVLIIEPTKDAAQRTARALAEEIEEDDPECAALAALASTRLNPAHPLVEVLRRGVGFHHAALPGDIQAELEDGIRKGPLRYLVATTTLIEGINFPVRSVLIGDRGYPSADGYVTTLNAPKLLNAVGRAGRAGRETEGWIVLSLNERFTPQAFDPLTGDDEELTAASRLSTEDALEALAAFEELVRRGQDAIMQTAGGAAADFIAHVWFVADALRELDLATTETVPLSIVSTLAWQQLDQQTRERWWRVAALAADRFEATPPEVRRRWARTGTSLPHAVLLEQLAEQVRAELASVPNRRDPVAAFRFVSDRGRLGQLLGIHATRAARFRPRRNAPLRTAFDVDLRSLIVDWLRGEEVGDIGTTYLAVVTDDTYRYEQLSEFIAQVLEHLLPWLLSTLISWVNEGLEEEDLLCPELPAYIRFGVDTPVALELAQAGVRSRRLVHAVAEEAASSTDLPVRTWLTETDVRTWRQLFDASPNELGDLLVFSRAQGARITSRVLAGEVVEIPLVIEGSPEAGNLEIREAEEELPPRLAAFRDSEVIGYVRSEHQDDVGRLLAIGVPLSMTLTEEGSLRIVVNDPTERTAWLEEDES